MHHQAILQKIARTIFGSSDHFFLKKSFESTAFNAINLINWKFQLGMFYVVHPSRTFLKHLEALKSPSGHMMSGRWLLITILIIVFNKNFIFNPFISDSALTSRFRNREVILANNTGTRDRRKVREDGGSIYQCAKVLSLTHSL